MLRRAFVVLCVGFVFVFAASCGQTYQLQSITVAPSAPNLNGIGATQLLDVTAHYSNTKTEDVTTHSIFDGSSLPAGVVTLTNGGALEAIGYGCTWTSTLNPDGTTYSYATAPYTVNVSYTENGVTKTFQVFVSVATAADCYNPDNPEPPPV